jgi:hypothetical protein
MLIRGCFIGSNLSVPTLFGETTRMHFFSELDESRMGELSGAPGLFTTFSTDTLDVEQLA